MTSWQEVDSVEKDPIASSVLLAGNTADDQGEEGGKDADGQGQMPSLCTFDIRDKRSNF